MEQTSAPGQPGIPPTWTSSAKDMVGCAIGSSRVWFTLGFGIVNEVYYPRVDIPQIRDLGFIVADGKGFWVEVKRLENYAFRLLAPGVPAVEITHKHERFELTLRVTPDPDRDVLAIELSLEGDADLRPYVLLAPHLGATGVDNLAEVRTVGTRRALGAEQGPFGLALIAIGPDQRDALGDASAGYVGVSDGWQDFDHNGAFTWRYPAAGPGNVAMTAALPRKCVLGLGFGSSIQTAATLAISSLAQPFDTLLHEQIRQWTQWHADRNVNSLLNPDTPTTWPTSSPCRRWCCGCTATRSIRAPPWPASACPGGNSHDDRGGYHLVWPRDLVQCALAMLGLGARREARNTLRYLIATQNADGGWNQNQWLGGTPYWQGVQLDETAFPILLAAALSERGALEGIQPRDTVARALGFIARTGPSTAQDRWEENTGLNPFTLAVSIAGPGRGRRLRVGPGPPLHAGPGRLLEREHRGVAGGQEHRAGRPHGRRRLLCAGRAGGGAVRPRRPAGVAADQEPRPGGDMPIGEEVGVDFLQLVRFGLRAPDDPWILDSIKVADALLKVDTPNGPAWRRYVGDGYGEHEDGSPFDGSGVGRAWPLLAGERGHYELAAGRDATPYLRAMAAMTGPAGMIPEQVWDSAPLPQHRLQPGQPSGSAMPLAWAHAEFIKLMISRDLGHAVDRPEALWRRYGGRRPDHATAIWCPHAPIVSMPAGTGLMVATPRPIRLHWGVDGWTRPADAQSVDTGLGVHFVELDAVALGSAGSVDFTFQWLDDGQWVGSDFAITRRTAA
ncbi:MAG: glycoside hydrolase family 15 protein [Caulobacteraceae bacterium]